MNALAIVRYAVKPGAENHEVFGASDLAVPIIDGTPLFEILGPGLWPGIPFQWLLDAHGQWPGRPDYSAWERSIILDGSCRVADCCGLVADVTVHADTVVWSGFYCHGSATIPPDLRFEFARTPYEASLGVGSDTALIDWVETPGLSYGTP